MNHAKRVVESGTAGYWLREAFARIAMINTPAEKLDMARRDQLLPIIDEPGYCLDAVEFMPAGGMHNNSNIPHGSHARR